MYLAQLRSLGTGSTVFTTYDVLVPRLVARILLFGLFVAGLIFFLRLLIAGFAFLTASGEPGKIQAATKSLINAITGLVIVVSAYFIAQIIQSVFGLRIL